jgi:hypothetical protein
MGNAASTARGQQLPDSGEATAAAGGSQQQQQALDTSIHSSTKSWATMVRVCRLHPACMQQLRSNNKQVKPTPAASLSFLLLLQLARMHATSAQPGPGITAARASPLLLLQDHSISGPWSFLVKEEVQCLCEGGRSCSHENPARQKAPNAIAGLHSSWVSDQVLAMARPWQDNVLKHDVVSQFKQHNIGMILNLQEVRLAHAHAQQQQQKEEVLLSMHQPACSV